ESRSLMNVTFRLPSEELEKKFVKDAEAAGFDGLKGHRSVGGIRASIYNAFPEEGVEALTAFMPEFDRRNGCRDTIFQFFRRTEPFQAGMLVPKLLVGCECSG